MASCCDLRFVTSGRNAEDMDCIKKSRIKELSFARRAYPTDT
jgi:hypothetical protein